ncbi:MAG: TolC family protein [Bacteroidetes bacterium]|nr:TolC family protein [Bacteroidota bacterium]MCL1968836.1 TolC family protein [Bacteroidota bacterium]MCL1969144.1 TolC family protein [Bacteroidota bacterium]
MKPKLFCSFLLLISFFCAKTQTLTLADCVQQALESNYGIQIAKNSENISRVNLKSYSVFLPVIYGDANYRSSYNNSKIERVNGEIIEFHNSNALNDGASLNMNWRIFDGLSMFFTNSKNKVLLDISTLNTVLEIEQLIANVSAAYYNVWIQTKLLEATENIVDISMQRFNIANSKYQIGAISGLEYRQSKIDLNADSSQLMLQKQALTNAYISLNTLMNRDLTKENYVQDTLTLMPLFNYNQIVDSALQNNSSLLIYQKGIRLSQMEVKNSLSQFFPSIDFTTGYQYSNALTPASVTSIQSMSHGFYWGLTARIPIFSRMENLRNNKVAKYQLQNAELQYKDVELSVLSALAELYNVYKNNHVLLEFEMENVEITSETLEIALEKYRIGSLSGVEFREFQRSYIEAVKRLMNASYQAKVSEIGLQLLSGKLK